MAVWATAIFAIPYDPTLAIPMPFMAEGAQGLIPTLIAGNQPPLADYPLYPYWQEGEFAISQGGGISIY